MRKLLLTIVAMLAFTSSVMAQRIVDKLDRGLIAQKVSGGIFVSWRILGEEYYDVKYNLYRDGVKVNAEPLDVSNYTDAAGTVSSKYSVKPVVRGIEQASSKEVTPWSAGYLEIKPKHSADIKSTLVPNDACCCDVDGDGELEILMKYDNADEIGQSFPYAGPKINGVSTNEYSIFECLKLDGTVLWWVNCGPNMGDFQNNEQNIVGYDWNLDGKAEVVMRLLEGSSIHYADGTVYTIGADGKNGTSWHNYRGATGGGTNWFMHDGNEFLVYCNGQTGKIYDIISYPLARLEPGETDLNAAWGDGYGHRCSKFFFGAPYLDGKKPSIFLARGIYTQIKMCAFDVDTATNKLKKRWDWRQNQGGFWMWQGYHNFGVADVDMDGRDEICYGSMVIDDNGKGLSTTGLGHGDAQHCGDFNPYIHGLEIYACNEDQPGNNYRDATTSKMYHRFSSGNDDGRAMAGNFTNAYPGAQGCSSREGLISLVYNEAAPGLTTAGVNTNFRIYWDGDLLEETFNYRNGKNTEGVVAKYGSWTPIYICDGSITNNDTKGTPCYQGDVFGDWREEIIMRTASNNIRIYSTPTPTKYRNYTLWHDHQYRNAMVWQMCGYNQPPHVSYFLGELEGITMAPPPLTMTGRTEVKNGETIGASLNDKHVIVCENGNSSVAIEEGAKPYILTFNVPSWVQGTAGTNYQAKDATIKYDYYTCTVTGGAITGEARLVKQGDGELVLPKVDMTHTGSTDIWEGKLKFDGTMKKSAVWLNRFTELHSDGGVFMDLKANYDAKIFPGGKDNIGTIKVDSTLFFDYGAHLMIDIKGKECDKIVAKHIKSVKKTGEAWTKYGPEFIQPIIEVSGDNIEAGDYVIAEAEDLEGSVTNFKIVGVKDFKTGLKFADGKLILTLGSTRGAESMIWTGSQSSAWNYANSLNFVAAGDAEKTPDYFVNGDFVEFNDEANNFNINLTEDLEVDTMFFNNTKAYTLQGEGSIKSGAYVKENTGTVTISTNNTYTGGNHLKGGTTIVSKLSNSVNPVGNLGGITTNTNYFTLENGAILQSTAAVTNGSPLRMIGETGGVINNSGDFIMEKGFYGTILTKKGSGWLKTKASGNGLSRMIIAGGTVQNGSGNAAQTVEFQGGSLVDNVGTSCTMYIAKGKTGSWTTANRQTFSNRITGEGKITIYCATEKGSTYYATRTPLALNLSAFAGTIVPNATYTADGRFTLSTSNGSNTCTFDIPEGIIVQNEGKTMSIGTVIGKGALGGSCTFSNGASVGVNTWNVGNETNFTFPGKVESNAKFNKVGTGVMTASGVWTTTGAVNVKEGTLKFNNKVSLGTGALTVDKGAVLQCTGSSINTKLANSSITINGTLMPLVLESAAIGCIGFDNKNVTISQTGTLRLGMAKASTGATVMSGCYLDGANKLTINGTLSLFFTYEPKVGDELRLWRNVSSFAGSPIIVCENYNVEFDESRLSEGVLVVKSVATGIKGVHADAEDNGVRYNIGGQRVNDNAKGIIIRNHKKVIMK